MNATRKILREPLLHFVLLGALLFAAFGWLGPRSSGSSSIVVTHGQISHMVNSFARSWQRAPSQQEMDDMVRDYVKEEAMVREALALGLDRDDLIIRRRLRQKMEFVSVDASILAKPDEKELQAFMEAHAARFASEPRLSFTQLFLDPQRHGSQLAAHSQRLLASLQQAGASRASATAPGGDPVALAATYDKLPLGDVEKLFGEAFAARLRQLPVGTWQGPLESAYGAHLVQVSAHTPGSLPPLSQVRETVLREWSSEQSRVASERMEQQLLSKYAVTVEASSAPVLLPARSEPVALR